jgi:hypothetical protein
LATRGSARPSRHAADMRLGPTRPIVLVSGEPPYLLNRVSYPTPEKAEAALARQRRAKERRGHQGTS